MGASPLARSKQPIAAHAAAELWLCQRDERSAETLLDAVQCCCAQADYRGSVPELVEFTTDQDVRRHAMSALWKCRDEVCDLFS
jgi:hypothetical protein